MAAANAQVPDSDDEELGVPLGQQPAASSASVPVATNPFPLNSPAGSPTNADPARAILEQLAATTQLLSNIVLNQNQQPRASDSTPVASSSSAGFSDANKVLSKPDPFGSTSHEADLSSFQDWVQTFRNWITFADGEYEKLLQVVEKNLDKPIDLTTESDEVKQRGTKLYAVLSSMLRHKPRTILKQVEGRNGYEVWRQLHNVYAPKTRARSLAILNALTGAPVFTKDKTIQEQLFALERISNEYTRVSGRSVGDDVLLGTLLRCLPAHIRSHIQLVMTEGSTYNQVRQYILAYETTTTTWSPQKVHQALGVVAAPQVHNDSGPVPMEIDMVQTKGKGKSKGKGKEKGKSGKGKGEQGKSGKGKTKDKGKGKGSGKKSSSVDAQSCLYCHKPGHWKRDCRKLKADIAKGVVTCDAHGVVRAVEQAPDNASVAASSAAVSTVAPSHSASNAQPKRVARVQLQPQVFRLDAEDGSGPVDLTIYDISQGDAEMDIHVNMISSVDPSGLAGQGQASDVATGLPRRRNDGSQGSGQVELEAMYAALDVCNEHAHEGLTALDARNQHVHSVRALQKRSEATIDIILDSGADCSRGSWSNLGNGVIGCKAMSLTFVDTTLVPVQSIRWYRTTLVQRHSRWYLAEFAEDISRLEALDAPLERPEEVEGVITLSYDNPDIVPVDLGFELVAADPRVPSGEPAGDMRPATGSPQPEGQGQGAQAGAQALSGEPLGPAAMDVVPSAPEVGAQEGAQAHAGPPNAIQVGDVEVTAGSSHAVLKAACTACGISTSGNRGQLWMRLSKHVVQQEALAEHGVAHTLERETTRQPLPQAVAAEPSAQQVHEHNLTHYPYKDWCPVCVCFKGRQDQHPSVSDHSGTSVSVLSFDYGFLSLRAGGDVMTALFAVDRQTKAVIGIPAKTKAGPSLSHTVTELARFVNWVGHNEIRFRCDNENPITKVCEATGDRISDCALSAICLIAEYDDVQSVCQIGELTLEHEDGVPEFVLDAGTANGLEDYEFGLDDDSYDDSNQELDPRLCIPRYDDSEPWMSPEALAELDDIADQHELARLQRMQVLLPPETLEGSTQPIKHLSTKMVRTWREKEDAASKPIWLRRSRYVAREFNWMSERSDCFSPASSAIANKLLPIIALQKNFALAAIDISDAFLTVKQKEPTLVEYIDKSGNRQSFALGRLLPGQRDGSKEWYLDFTQYLEQIISAQKCVAYPSLLRTPALDCLTQLHVDDVLVAALLAFLENELVAGLKQKYKVAVQILTLDNAITFLKKRHILLPGSEILIVPHPKHFEKLFALHGLKEGDCSKKTPFDPKLDEPDTSVPLEVAEASVFRTSLGILLYLSPELIECQNTIRALSAYMANPTRQAMSSLRHLVKYLLGASGNGLKLKKVAPGQGHAGWYDDPMPLETQSDSDWASSKGHRRSVSSSMVFVAGNLLYSASRCQRLVSLSSAEAEVHAATSTMCDGIFARLLIEFCTGHMPQVHHHLDSTAAMGILQRSGVGRIRHLSTRVLWTQQAVAEAKVVLHKISTDLNCADLGTKHMARARMRMLQFLLGSCDAYGNAIGEDDYLDFTAKQQFKKAVKAVQQVSPGQAKARVRQIMLAALMSMANATNALSPDDESNVNDNDQDDPDDGWMSPMMSLVSDAMAWMIVLYEQYPGLFTVVIQVALLILAFMIFGLCSYRRPVTQQRALQQDQDQASTGSQSPRVFNRPLNISIHMHQNQAAPGTPAMPYNISESESMNASVAESSSEPGIAGMSTASSSSQGVPCRRVCLQQGPRQRQSRWQGGWRQCGSPEVAVRNTTEWDVGN